MSYIPESSKYFRKDISSVQRRFCTDSNLEKSDPCFSLDGRVMRPEGSNSSRLHPSRRQCNTSRRSSEFEKIPTFLCRHGVGRQLAPVRTSGQQRPDPEILDKEIACIHSASVQTTGQHRSDAVLVMAITCRQSATVRTLGQHFSDAILIW